MINISPGIVAANTTNTRTPGINTIRMSAGIPTTRVVSSAGTSTTITSLSPANTYKIRVRALDATGNASAWSNELVLTTTNSFPLPTVSATASVPTPTVSAALPDAETLYTNQVPALPNLNEGLPVSLGTTVTFASAGNVLGVRFYAPQTVTGTYTAEVFRVTGSDPSGGGVSLGTATFGSLNPSAWNSALFSSAIPVVTNTAYRIVVRTSQGRYTATNNFYTAPLVNGNITGIQDGTDPVGVGTLRNGTYVTNGTGYPNQTFNATAYFIDPLFSLQTASPATVSLSPIAASASIPTPSAGGLPPTITMGLDRPVVTGGSVALDAVINPPAGATISSYLWEVISGSGSLINSTTATPTYIAPGSGAGTATIRVTVTASSGTTATATMVVGYGANVVAAENRLAGTARATWDLVSPNLGGISTLQGFCDGFSVNKTGTASFKIAQSDAAGWTAQVYRLGYYNGDGARLYGTLSPTGPQLAASQSQPAPADADPSTTLISADCSGWSTTLTWSPPSWAPSGMYVLRLNRSGGGASHIQFVVRDDARHADVMLMPSDSTWLAYNAWGGMGSGQYAGNSLYYGTAVDQYQSDCARFVSYNRPFVNRGAADVGRSYGAVEWSNFFTAEYPMLRFLERNGFDVKYYGCIDASGDASGTHLRGNGSTRGGVNAAIAVGHNEYWSDAMRSGWEAARDNGVSLFFSAGNDVFWRTVGTSPDADGRPRIQECQKSTIGGRGNTRPQWTGAWRDPDGAGKGGNSPENLLTGQIFAVNGPNLKSLAVPFAGGFSGQPIWRHTEVAALASGSWTSPSEILGFEWNVPGPAFVSTTAGNYMAPPHPRVRYLSDVTHSVSTGQLLTDAGDVYDANGTATHRLTVYPGGNGAMVFGCGTVNWALGLDESNTWQQGSDNTSTVLRQATVNMLVDMGAPPTTLMAGLTQPTLVDWFVDLGLATVASSTSVPSLGVAASASVTALPLPVAATASVPTPTVRGSATAAPAAVSATASVPAVAVRLSSAVTIGTVSATSAAPSIAASLSIASSFATVAAVSSVPPPALSAGATTVPVAVSGQTGVAQPTIAAGFGASVALSPVFAVAGVIPPGATTGWNAGLATAAAVAALPSFGVSASSRAQMVAVAAVAAVAPAAASAGQQVQMESAEAVADIFQPGIISGSATTVGLPEIEATVAIPASQVRSGAVVTLASVSASAAIAQPIPSAASGAAVALTSVGAVVAVPTLQVSAQSGSTPALVAVAARASTPAMAAQAGAGAAGQLAAASASIPVLAVRLAVTVRPTSTIATVTVWQPTMGADSAIQLTAILAHAAFPAPRLGMIPIVFAHPHSVTMARGTHSVTISPTSA